MNATTYIYEFSTSVRNSFEPSRAKITVAGRNLREAIRNARANGIPRKLSLHLDTVSIEDREVYQLA